MKISNPISQWFASLKKKFRLWRIGKNNGIISLDQCTFDVNSSVISPELKESIYKGSYELPERNLIKKHFKFNNSVIELGAGLGIVACLVNDQLSNNQGHYVIEANKELIPLIHRNKQLNKSTFDIDHAALSYEGTKTISFPIQQDILTSNFETESSKKSHPNPRTLNELLESIETSKIDLIVDIEGSEKQLIENEYQALNDRVDQCLFEFHPHLYGEKTKENLVAKIRDHFDVVDSMNNVFCLKNRRF